MNRKKIIAYLTAYSMFLTGCKLKLDDILNNNPKDIIENGNTTKEIITQIENDIITETIKLEEKIISIQPEINIPTLEPIDTPEISLEIQETEERPTIEQEEIELPQEQPIEEPTISLEEINLPNIEETNEIEDNKIIEEPIIEKTEETNEESDLIEEIVEETEEPTEDIIPEIEEPTIEDSKDNILAITTAPLNLRSNNTDKSIIIDCIPENATVYKIFSCDNNWDLVEYNNQIGYVYRDYLEYSQVTYEQEYSYTKASDIVITTTELNFRSEPNSNSSKITCFQKGTELQLIAKLDNGWLLVKSNGIIGYVHGDYVISLLELANLEHPELELKEINPIKVVYSTTTLNIRTGAGEEHEVIGTLEKYESVRVLEEHENWYFIMTNEYQFGFISKSYTKELEDNYVLVDLSEQRLYLYNNDELYYVTPVTTGKDSSPSDIGLFQIYSKETDVTLTDRKTYWSHVDYWMPYNRGEGLHDASWRSVFGTQSYKTNGSHGCINMPKEITDEIYENVSVGTKVLVHK